MTTYEEYLKEQLKDSDFRAEYERLNAEHSIARALISAKTGGGLTSRQLSRITGVRLGDIKKVIRCESDLSVETLQKLAAAMGTVLRVEFNGADYHLA